MKRFLSPKIATFLFICFLQQLLIGQKDIIAAYGSAFAQSSVDSKYIVCFENDYSTKVKNNFRKGLYKFIPIPCTTDNKKLLFKTNDEDSLLTGACLLFSKGKTKKLKKYLLSQNQKKNIHYLIESIFYLVKLNPNKAQKALTRYKPNEKYSFLYFLISADIFYEMNKNRISLDKITSKYQIALDSVKNKEQEKIVLKRIKLIKYGI